MNTSGDASQGIESDFGVLKAIEEYAEGVKFDSGKASLSLLDPKAMVEIARVMSVGASKYGRHNWRKGIAQSRLIDALLRHVFAYMGGEDLDPETGLSHIAHAAANCMMLLGLEGVDGLDDRLTPTAPKPSQGLTKAQPIQ